MIGVGARLENSCPLKSFLEGGIDPQLVSAGWNQVVKLVKPQASGGQASS